MGDDGFDLGGTTNLTQLMQSNQLQSYEPSLTQSNGNDSNNDNRADERIHQGPRQAGCNVSDLIQSRKETRQQKTLVSKLILEMENLKEKFCHIVDCTNDEEK